MPVIIPITKKQIDLEDGDFFRPEPLGTPGTQITVKAGYIYSGGRTVINKFTTGDQTTAAFGVVGSGLERYDLVYLNAAGVTSVLAGLAQAASSPIFAGAPGASGGPDMPDQAIPIAYVFIDETATVVVGNTDIYDIRGLFQQTRDLDGYLVDKGIISSPTGLSSNVTSLFSGETPGASSTSAGIITSTASTIVPESYTIILDHKLDELIHAATGARVFGYIAHFSGVWAIFYYYKDSSTGANVAVSNIQSECTVVPTSIKLIGVPKVFSRNDPNRPVFYSSHHTISDQVVGDIPNASETIKGKVELATSSETTALLAVQASDTRILIQDERNAVLTANVTGAPSASNPFVVADDPKVLYGFRSNYYYAYYTAASSSPGGRMVFIGSPVGSLTNSQYDISHNTTSGAFTVTSAGVYKIDVSGYTNQPTTTMKLSSPAGSTGAVPDKAGAFAGAGFPTPQGQDSCSLHALVSLAASGTFDVRITAGGFFTGINTHISIVKIT